MLRLILAAELAFMLSGCTLLHDQRPYLVIDAENKGAPLDDVEIRITSPDHEFVAHSTSSGEIIFSGAKLSDAQSVITIKKQGYITLSTHCPCIQHTYALSPELEDKATFRIVLTWDDPKLDLDGHIVFQGNRKLNNVYGEHRNSGNTFGMNLGGTQADLASGTSAGAETSTIYAMTLDKTYTYVVHNNTNNVQSGNKALSNSKARVFLYLGNTLIRIYDITPNTTGNLWAVLSLDFNGKLYFLNQIYDVALQPAEVGDYVYKTLKPDDETTVSQSDDIAELALAKQITYHAIDSITNSYQAYELLSNIYTAMGLTTESTWALKKSAAAAKNNNDMPNLARIHFKLGNIYESKKYLGLAYDEYKNASIEDSNNQYTEAAARIKDLIEKKNKAISLFNKAVNLFIQQDYSNALANFEEAKQLSPDTATSLDIDNWISEIHEMPLYSEVDKLIKAVDFAAAIQKLEAANTKDASRRLKFSIEDIKKAMKNESSFREVLQLCNNLDYAAAMKILLSIKQTNPTSVLDQWINYVQSLIDKKSSQDELP